MGKTPALTLWSSLKLNKLKKKSTRPNKVVLHFTVLQVDKMIIIRLGWVYSTIIIVIVFYVRRLCQCFTVCQKTGRQTRVNNEEEWGKDRMRGVLLCVVPLTLVAVVKRVLSLTLARSPLSTPHPRQLLLSPTKQSRTIASGFHFIAASTNSRIKYVWNITHSTVL